MGDHEGPWSRFVTSIALRRGAGLRSPLEGEPTSKFVLAGAARVAAPLPFRFKVTNIINFISQASNSVTSSVTPRWIVCHV
ncbi:hypothetical protein SADUNF_Sadunf13G0093600 [Salix dunnii]|uniref:Uncharacterized protein n=1 Tax=Salix dunnii TaxID=1413687 RepID=A0A835JJ66_9ROSI|nr:hypothetical protein SADUNF_Sadunf13G0093600 [Salix dunnii]